MYKHFPFYRNNNYRRLFFILVRLTTFFLFSAILYVGLFILGFDLHLQLMKLESLLLGRGLSFLLQRVGWEVGLFFSILLALLNLEGAPTLGNMMLPEGTQGPTSSSASAGDPMSLDRTSGDPMSVSYEQPRSAGNPPKESVASNPIEGGRASSSKTRRHIEDEVMKSLTDLLDREGEKSDISRDAISDILKLHKRTEPELHAVLSHLHYEGVRSPWYRETLERQRVLETLSEDEDA